MQDQSKELTRKELAFELKVEPDTVYRWEKEGKVKPARKQNGRPRYILEEVKTALNTQGI